MYTVGLVSTRFKGNSELLDVLVTLFGLGGGEEGGGAGDWVGADV